MTPVVTSIFPDPSLWTESVDLVRGAKMYPGVFFQAIIAFIISLLLLFIFVEMLFRLYNLSKKNNITKLFIIWLPMVIGMLLILGLVVWNLYDVFVDKDKEPTSSPNNTSTAINPFTLAMF